MKLQIVSDLHLDDHNYNKVLDTIYTPDSDVLIVVGDMCSGFLCNPDVTFYLDALAKQFPLQEILYVPGNHDFWGESIEDALKILKQPIAKNLHMLYNDSITIGNHTFYGTTLWFKEDPLNYLYSSSYCDFRYISKFRTTYQKENSTAIDFIKNIPEGSILLTHFMPHPLSVSDVYKNDDLNRFFLCDISDVLEDRKPKLVIHGHTHHVFDYTLEYGTRVICNPYGYHYERVKESFKQVIITV